MSPTDVASMEARYKLELSERDPKDIIDLNLDNCSSDRIFGLDDKLVNLQSLSILNAGLVSLEGLPSLPSLVKLDLSNNLLSEGFEIVAKNCPNLLHLNLSGNSIESADVLKVLHGSKVAEIDIFANPISADASHREQLFAALPDLMILDGCDANGAEIKDELDSSDEDAITDEEDLGDEAITDDEDDIGLSYLNKSQFSDDEEDDDYDPEAAKTRKRGADDAANETEEPPAKKEA